MHKEVKPVEGEPLRYWVESSEETPHFVDLSEFDGNGECSCNNFKYRCRAHMKEYGRIVNHGFPNATRCKHINTAMMYMADTIIYQFNENQKKQFGYVRANGSNDPEVERLRYGAQRQVQLPGDRREPAAGGNSNGGEQPEYDWTQG